MIRHGSLAMAAQPFDRSSKQELPLGNANQESTYFLMAHLQQMHQAYFQGLLTCDHLWVRIMVSFATSTSDNWCAAVVVMSVAAGSGSSSLVHPLHPIIWNLSQLSHWHSSQAQGKCLYGCES